MKYGAKGPKWAPLEDKGSTTAQPTYGTVIELDKLSQVDDTISLTNTSAYGDDAKAVEITEFTTGEVKTSLLNMSEDDVNAIYGVTKGASGGLDYRSDDLAPYGAFGFTTSCMDGDGNRYYQAVFYPKLKAKTSDTSYATKGENITLSLDTLNFTMYQADCKSYKITQTFDSEAAATAYLDGLFDGKSRFPALETA